MIYVKSSIIFSFYILHVQGCGTTGKSRIIGGSPGFGFMYPWFTILEYSDTGSNACGAVLISDTYVLTAAHCFEAHLDGNGQPTSPLEDAYDIVLGSYNLCAVTEPTRRKYKALKVFVHEDYRPQEFFSDIALLKLDKKASLFTPICLPDVEDQLPREAQVIGNGVTYFGNTNTPCATRSVKMIIYSTEECNSTWNPESFIGPGTFCSGDTRGGKDACQGDSGGPIQYINNEGRYTTVGIVSFGSGCGFYNQPGINTDVHFYLEWIKEKLQEPIEKRKFTNKRKYFHSSRYPNASKKRHN